MKRKILSVLAVLVAMLMSTVVLTACEKAPAGAESSGGSSESMSTEQGGEPVVGIGDAAQDQDEGHHPAAHGHPLFPGFQLPGVELGTGHGFPGEMYSSHQ